MRAWLIRLWLGALPHVGAPLWLHRMTNAGDSSWPR